MDCVFCKIIKGEIPSSNIYEDDNVFVFLDISPQSKGHTLVIPKQHFENIFEIPETILIDVMRIVKATSLHLKEKLHCEGLNIKQNNGELAGQTVNHLHFHLIPQYSEEKEYDLEELFNILKIV